MPKYRVLGTHPQTVKVGDATPSLAPGEFVELTDTDVNTRHNAALVKEGMLIDVSTIKADKEEKPSKEDKGVTNNA